MKILASGFAGIPPKRIAICKQRIADAIAKRDLPPSLIESIGVEKKEREKKKKKSRNVEDPLSDKARG
jgi:hypothetical protein